MTFHCQYVFIPYMYDVFGFLAPKSKVESFTNSSNDHT